MSAFGTKKPGADEATQLTFPDVFAATIRGREQYGYQPDAPSESSDIVSGGIDLQAQYHEQKRRDANFMAGAKVGATRSSEKHMLSFHNNYDVPKPVLGQRVFANPSLGAGGAGGDIYSARQDLHGSGRLEGGVLRTAVGQKYGLDRLRDRIPQLEAITQAKNEMLGLPSVAPEANEETLVNQGVSEAVPSGDKIELISALNAIGGAIDNDEINKYAMSETGKMIRLLIRICSTENRTGLEDILTWFDTYLAEMVEVLGDRIEDVNAPDYEPPDIVSDLGSEFPERASISTARFERAKLKHFTVKDALYNYIRIGREYVLDCLANVNLSAKDRQTASKSAIKSLGLTKVSTFEKRYERDEIKPPKKRGESNAEVGRELREMVDAPLDNELVFFNEGARAPQNAIDRHPNGFDPMNPYRDAFADLVIPENTGSGKRSGFKKSVRKGSVTIFTVPQVSDSIRRGKLVYPDFIPAPRDTFGERQGAYLFEENPNPEAPPSNAPQRRLKANELRPTQPAPYPTWGIPGEPGIPTPEGEDWRYMSREELQEEALDERTPTVSVPKSAKPKPGSSKVRLNKGRSSIGRTSMLPPEGAETPLQILSQSRIVKNVTGSGKSLKEILSDKPNPMGLTKDNLPKTREGLVKLVAHLKGMGHKIRVNSGSQPKNIRANIIKKLGLAGGAGIPNLNGNTPALPGTRQIDRAGKEATTAMMEGNEGTKIADALNPSSPSYIKDADIPPISQNLVQKFVATPILTKAQYDKRVATHERINAQRKAQGQTLLEYPDDASYEKYVEKLKSADPGRENQLNIGNKAVEEEYKRNYRIAQAFKDDPLVIGHVDYDGKYTAQGIMMRQSQAIALARGYGASYPTDGGFWGNIMKGLVTFADFIVDNHLLSEIPIVGTILEQVYQRLGPPGSKYWMEDSLINPDSTTRKKIDGVVGGRRRRKGGMFPAPRPLKPVTDKYSHIKSKTNSGLKEPYVTPMGLYESIGQKKTAPFYEGESKRASDEAYAEELRAFQRFPSSVRPSSAYKSTVPRFPSKAPTTSAPSSSAETTKPKSKPSASFASTTKRSDPTKPRRGYGKKKKVAE